MTDTKKKQSEGMAKDGTIVFEFTIPASDIAHEYRHVLQEYAEHAEIKGFRKGKAPVAIVEKSLDKSKVYSHLLEHILPPAYGKALDANKFIPVIEPRITPLSMEEGKDWVFKAETAGRPQIKLGEYKKYVAEALKKAPKPAKDDKTPVDDQKLSIALDALLKNSDIAVSPLLVDEETKSALGKLVNQLASLKLSVDDYAKSVKKTKEELIQEYQKTAEVNLKVEFLVSEVIKDLDPKVDDEEVAKLKPAKGQESYARYLVQKKSALDFLSAL